MTWQPKLRQIKLHERPEWIPKWIYIEAVTAKRFYNEQWEFWVWQESLKHNKSQAETEDACIRGLQKAINRIHLVYGSKIGKWYEEFLEMGDIFRKVKHPEYIAQLGE